MDGIHDLGGREGFGPIKREGENKPFKNAADARAFALAQAIRSEGGFFVDWFRYVRELIEPEDYISRPYFDQWLQTCIAMSIDHGDLSLEEIQHGRTDSSSREYQPTDRQKVDKILTYAANFEKETENQPLFKPGDLIRTIDKTVSGHTRLPLYARGRRGTVVKWHKAHIFADDSARGLQSVQHLYSVCFRTEDLWNNGESRSDEIYLDLYESYLTPFESSS